MIHIYVTSQYNNLSYIMYDSLRFPLNRLYVLDPLKVKADKQISLFILANTWFKYTELHATQTTEIKLYCICISVIIIVHFGKFGGNIAKNKNKIRKYRFSCRVWLTLTSFWSYKGCVKPADTVWITMYTCKWEQNQFSVYPWMKFWFRKKMNSR